jgi:hypothetical protein
LAEEAAREKVQHAVNGNDIVKPDESKIRDIEESVLDGAFEKKRLEKILDKTRQVPQLASPVPFLRINLIVFYFPYPYNFIVTVCFNWSFSLPSSTVHTGSHCFLYFTCFLWIC